MAAGLYVAHAGDDGNPGTEKQPFATPVESSCEYAANPLGIDTLQPRFGWLLASNHRGVMQQAYQILVASSPERLAADTGDLWDSGKVQSDESFNVGYRGGQLFSRQQCFWKVRVWDDQGRLSPWSKPSLFEMGLLAPAEWHGRWIGLGGEKAAAVSPLLRNQFEVTGPIKRARLYAAGIGWSEYYLNGKRIGDAVLDPATTDYDKRILYVTHDVTRLVRSGPNALGVMLGNGWFSPPPPDRGYSDSPCLLLELVIELDDGKMQRVVSDENWRASPGPILKNDLWGGEVYDARLDKAGWLEPNYDDSSWAAATVRKSPGGRLEAQMLEPIKVNKVLQPVKMTNPKPGIFVYDFGQLFGGWARLRVKGPAGTKIALRYAEKVFPDTGLVDKRRHYLTPDGATDFYSLKGDPAGECYEPHFTFHPVRYVQIEGFPGKPALVDMEGCVVFNSIDMTGDFQCSNPLLNQIHRNCVWTFTNSMYSITLDCLYREHWGWLEPASIPSTLFSHRYIPRFWTKFIGDAQCAQHPDGVIPDVVPAYPHKGRNTGDPAWAGNYPPVVWYVYQYYGDRRLLENHYPNMKRWVDHLTSIAENNIIQKGYYGDHMLPGGVPGQEQFISNETPPALLWTGYYYLNTWIVCQAARILGAEDDAASYGRLAEAICIALNKKWLDAPNNRYVTGSQTANAFALALGVVPEANRQGVLNSLATDILATRRGHLHMGNLGITCSMDSLGGLGRGDVLYRVATSTDYPGWGYMVREGATTVWEAWSNNVPGTDVASGMVVNDIVVSEDSMPMFGSINKFFFDYLAGIEGPQYFGTRTVVPGFREIRIRPRVLGDLTSAAAHIRTVRGIVGVDWQRGDNSLSLRATVPGNARAKISVPKAGLRDIAVEEGGKLVWQKGAFLGGVPGIAAGAEESEYVTFDTGSGTYRFILRGNN